MIFFRFLKNFHYIFLNSIVSLHSTFHLLPPFLFHLNFHINFFLLHFHHSLSFSNFVSLLVDFFFIVSTTFFFLLMVLFVIAILFLLFIYFHLITRKKMQFNFVISWWMSLRIHGLKTIQICFFFFKIDLNWAFDHVCYKLLYGCPSLDCRDVTFNMFAIMFFCLIIIFNVMFSVLLFVV